jgi:peroxiredoxin
MKNNKNYTVLTIILLIPLVISAQNTNIVQPLQIGKPCPDFHFQDVKNYEKKDVYIHDLRGKWVLLDYFTRGCTGCIAMLPKIDKFYHHFKDKAVVLSVGVSSYRYDPKQTFSKFYAGFEKRLNLTTPFVLDSVNYKKYRIPVISLVVIDDKGIVRAITDWVGIDEQSMNIFLNGGTPLLTEEKSETLLSYNRNKPFLINGNGGADTDYLFRSVLTKARVNTPSYRPWNMASDLSKGKFELLNATLGTIYMYAYFGMDNIYYHDPKNYGNYYNYPVIETKDSALFSKSRYTRGNSTTIENYYCYSLSIPVTQVTKEKAQLIVQNDLQKYFGYNVSIETRFMPYWKITLSEQAKNKLKTKGGVSSFKFIDDDSALSVYTNKKVKDIVKLLQEEDPENIYLDESNVDGGVDVSIPGDGVVPEDFKNGMKMNGFIFKRATRPMKVLVIRDPS